MTTVAMPRLSDSMEEGTIVSWLVVDGAEVSAGDDLLEVETDKATITHTAEATGIVRLLAVEGDAVAVGSPIAEILPADGSAGGAADAPEGGSAAAPAAVPQANGSERAKASPLARRLARELGVSLSDVRGSGPRGRIVRGDVEAAAAGAAAVAEPAPVAPPASTGSTVVEPTRVQRTIARRMTEAKTTIPDFQVRADADVTDLLRLRGELKAAELKVSVNDFVVRACALALVRHPRVNASFRDDLFHLHPNANVGVAVAADDTLLVPVVHDADSKPVTRIGEEVQALAARARDGTIAPSDLEGGTFTVSNLGMHGVSSFTAIVNPGQAAILAVGAARQQLALVDGEVRARELLELSLSCDHRILYGADAARFLGEVRELLEAPHRLLA